MPSVDTGMPFFALTGRVCKISSFQLPPCLPGLTRDDIRSEPSATAKRKMLPVSNDAQIRNG